MVKLLLSDNLLKSPDFSDFLLFLQFSDYFRPFPLSLTFPNFQHSGHPIKVRHFEPLILQSEWLMPRKYFPARTDLYFFISSPYTIDFHIDQKRFTDTLTNRFTSRNISESFQKSSEEVSTTFRNVSDYVSVRNIRNTTMRTYGSEQTESCPYEKLRSEYFQLTTEWAVKATNTRCDLLPRFFCIDATLLCEYDSNKTSCNCTLSA